MYAYIYKYMYIIYILVYTHTVFNVWISSDLLWNSLGTSKQNCITSSHPCFIFTRQVRGGNYLHKLLPDWRWGVPPQDWEVMAFWGAVLRWWGATSCPFHSDSLQRCFSAPATNCWPPSSWAEHMSCRARPSTVPLPSTQASYPCCSEP